MKRIWGVGLMALVVVAGCSNEPVAGSGDSNVTASTASFKSEASQPSDGQVKSAVTEYIRSIKGDPNAGFSIEVIGVQPHGSGYRAWGSIGVANTAGETAGGYWGADLDSQGKVTGFDAEDSEQAVKG